MLIVSGAGSHALLLGNGDLYVVDKARAPDRFKNGVGEAQHHQIFHGLLAQVMIDTEDLALVEVLCKLAVNLGRTGEVVADGLFDDDAGEGPVGIGAPDHAGRGQASGARVDELRGYREIEDVVAAGIQFEVEFTEALLELLIVARLSE